jgi:hypothetical protein
VTNDELAVKLAQMEGFLQGVGESVKRIEGAIDKVIAIDRTVAEHAIRFESQGRELRDLGHDIKNCHQQHTLAAELQGKRTDKLEDDANKVIGAISAMRIFSGFAAFMVMTGAGWVYNRIEKNSEINSAQTHEIADLRREVSQLQKLGEK